MSCHYSVDCELISPFINKLSGIKKGVSKGKQNIGEFWEMALDKLPELRLEMIDVAVYVNYANVSCFDSYEHESLKNIVIKSN